MKALQLCTLHPHVCTVLAGHALQVDRVRAPCLHRRQLRPGHAAVHSQGEGLLGGGGGPGGAAPPECQRGRLRQQPAQLPPCAGEGLHSNFCKAIHMQRLDAVRHCIVFLVGIAWDSHATAGCKHGETARESVVDGADVKGCPRSTGFC